MSENTSFIKYFEKAFGGLKPIIAWALTALACILFPDKIYLCAVMAVTGAALCDIVTKWWSICRNGGVSSWMGWNDTKNQFEKVRDGK